MNDDTKRGFTTAILHSDRDAPIEHGALHKPLHLSVAYGYRDARELAAVFQGRATGLRLRPPGQSDLGGARGQGHRDGGRRRHRDVRHRDGGDRRDHDGAAQGRRPHRVQPVRVRQHVEPAADARGARPPGLVRRRDRCRPRSRPRSRRRRASCSSRRSPIRACRSRTCARIGELCRARGIVYIVDNTMTSPWLFQPKDVGAGARSSTR